jgi:hypothetical protein
VSKLNDNLEKKRLNHFGHGMVCPLQLHSVSRYSHTSIRKKPWVLQDIFTDLPNEHGNVFFDGLTNISRYDIPDAEVYKDFFRLYQLYDFKPLASTSTFFRGCPLDKLDTAIANELW